METVSPLMVAIGNFAATGRLANTRHSADAFRESDVAFPTLKLLFMRIGTMI